MNRVAIALIWILLALVAVTATVAAAGSPLLAWRDPVYIIAGFAGVIAMSLLLFQPLLAVNLVPEFAVRRSRQAHRWVGIALLLSVLTHIVGLWITSPPDMVDALLLRSPTPFSVWGVIAMWCLFATAGFVALRKRMRLRLRTWRWIHKALGFLIVFGSVVHAIRIEGTMEVFSKWLLCVLVLVATAVALAYRRLRL